MNIHEYQGKSLLKGFGVAIQEGIVADTPEEAVEYAVKHFNSISFILREFKSKEFFKGIFILGKLKRSTVLTRSIVIKALEEEDSE